MRSGNRDLQLITKEVPASFTSRFVATGTKWWLFILVSPWITPLTKAPYTLEDILKTVRDQRVATYVITRPPDATNPGHNQAVAQLSNVPSVELRFNESLHAKVLLAEGPRAALGLLGSANLTTAGHTGAEVGVLMHGRGYGEVLIRDLIDFCIWDLRQASLLVKRRASRRDS